ncbi:MAG: hypothetical protein ACRCX2_27720 [Paraclostridium sp.]
MIQGRLVLNDGRELEIELLEENLKSIETYLRSGRVSSALLKSKEANSSVVGELMYDDKGMITIKMEDNSIIPIKTAEYSLITMYIENNLEVRDTQIKQETDGKHFYQTGTNLQMKRKLDNNKLNTNVLTVFQRDGLGNLEPQVVVPYMDVNHIVVPTYIGPTDNDWQFPLLSEWMQSISDWLTRLETLLGATFDTLEQKQLDPNLLNAITPTTAGTDLKFKLGTSMWYCDSSNSAWANLIHQICPSDKGIMRVLVINTRYNNTSMQEIIPQVYNETTGDYTMQFSNTGLKKIIRYWKVDAVSWSNPIIQNETALDERNIIWGDKRYGKSIKISKLADAFNTGTYFFTGTDNNTPMLRSGVRSTTGILIASCYTWNRTDNNSIIGVPLGTANMRSIYIDIASQEMYYSSPYVVTRMSESSLTTSSIVWYKLAGHTVDNLLSTSPTDVLSANQGRILNEKKLDKGNLPPGINNAGDIMIEVNNKADTTIFNDHITNTTNHITNEERNYWNVKLQKSDVIDNLTSTVKDLPLSANMGRVLNDILVPHTNDKTIHITSVERTSWNAKLQSSDVVDNLTSTSTTTPLSANQGRLLNVNKINTSSIIDNLSSSSTSAVLSANMGRHLNNIKWNNGSSSLTLNGYTVTIV